MNRNDECEDLQLNAPIDLTGLDDAYKRASANRNDDYYADVPDGTYDAEIRDAHLSRTRTEKPMVVWRMILTSAPDLHKTITKTRVITENTVPWLKEDLQKCGLMLGKLSELNQRVGEMEGRLVRVEKKTINGKGELYFRWPDRQKAEPVLGLMEEEADIPF
jgi:hypothetical protein